MITICGILELGHDQKFEHLCWRQLKGAWGVNLILVGHNFDTMEEALDACPGSKVFFIPPGRVSSIDFDDYKPPDGDVTYIFGRPGNNLVRYVGDDIVVSIHTPGATDMMAVSVVGIVLNVHG